MGLIKAGAGALGGVLADQWKEFFYCDSLDKEVLVAKGQKRVSGRSSNTRGSDNVISNGSGIAVADGQCMIIVEQGKIVEVCAEPGEFTYDSSTEPSIFSGSLGESVKATFRTIGKRFTFGGDTARDQRVYYFNTKELIDNKFGTQNPIQFKTYDRDTNFAFALGIRCNGTYSYKIVDPLLFYTNLCGNVTDEYRREELDSTLRSEFVSALQPAFAKLSAQRLDYTEIPAYTQQLADEMNSVLSSKWRELRGISIVSVAVNTVSASEKDFERIQKMQEAAAMGSNAFTMAGRLAGAQAQAMEDAAKNTAGSMTGFMGMGFAGQAGGMNAGDFYAMGVEQQSRQPRQTSSPAGEETWQCSCGATVTGNFCSRCGAKKPADESWQCSCGATVTGNFCSRCGAKKPAGAPIYRCKKCGRESKNSAEAPRFCPQCGEPFEENN